MHVPAMTLALVLAFVAGSPARLHAADDADELMPGRVTVIRPGTFKFVAKPPANTAFALPSPANEPTAAGGSLHVFDLGATADDDTYALPASGWKGLGNPPGSKGFKYKGDGSAADPCKVALVKPAVVKAVCKGTGMLLTPPFTGNVAVVLTVGAASKRYCAAFGGDETANQTGLLKRTDAPAAACGLVAESTSQPVSGGGTVSSDDGEGDGATPTDPLETAVTSPVGGTVTIVEGFSGTAPAGYVLANQAAEITAPPSSPTAPLTIEFVLDASQLRPGDSELTVQVFRNGVLVPACVGAPTEAYPDPCVFERLLLPGNDVVLGVRSAHASAWTFGFPLCGNGNPTDPGEACDPPGAQAQCGAGQVCKSDCTCSATCDCCAAAPTKLTIGHVPAAGTCGTATLDSGGLFKSLNCGRVYFGGGNNAYPDIRIPDSSSVMAVTGCNAATETLTLGPSSSLDTGSASTCTATGCRFGGPVAAAVTTTPSISTCLLVSRVGDDSGTASCDGVASIAMHLSAAVYLTGDSSPDPGIQPCPRCLAGTCAGGPNNGLACTPETSVVDPDAYPTSADCPPSAAQFVGTIALGANVTTGTAQAEAKPSGTQQRVFCGYCRDADGTGDFANPPFECDSNADCGPVSPVFESCEQRHEGAFGPNGNAVQTITLSGTVPGCLADGLPHNAKVAAALCVPPTYNGAMDGTGDLPGPAAASLTGTFQLQP
jgi:hypothetical protein